MNPTDDIDPMPASGPATEPSPAAPVGILCVDDEPNVLASLRRLFAFNGYRVRLATSGVAALAMLDLEAADVVISDLGMPDMDGTQFLQQVRERWPHSIRLLLTGHTEASSIIDAINRGEISRYITKPWVDEELVQVVREALERKAREQEKLRLAAIALRRAEELKALNSGLEQNANASKDELTLANERLKNNFVVSLKIFASLIEVRRSHMAGHSRRVADLARKLATKLGLEPLLVQEVFVAGLLHEVGKLGLSDDLLNTPVASMKPWQLQEYREHPVRGEQVLMPLQDLRGAAASIGAQLERFDGGGHPNHLRGRAILVGARILAVCADYDNLQIGVLVPRSLSPREAQTVIEGSAGKRYDPWVVESFIAIFSGDAPLAKAMVTPDINELVVGVGDLIAGMVLTRDLVSPSGLMMLPSHHALDDRLIQKVIDFEKSSGVSLTIYVKG